MYGVRKEFYALIRFKTKKVLALREMTQKELAELTGIRPPTISALCVGTAKHIPVDVLDKICFVLSCQPADLIEYVSDATVEVHRDQAAQPAASPAPDLSALPPELVLALQNFLQNQKNPS